MVDEPRRAFAMLYHRDKAGLFRTNLAPVIRCSIGLTREDEQLHTLGGPTRTVSGAGVLDTGASHTCAEEQALRRAGLPPSGRRDATIPSGRTSLLLYDGRLHLPGIDLEMDQLQLFGGLIGSLLAELDQGTLTPVIALIGRDVLAHCRFDYHGPSASFTLTREDV